MTGIDFSRQILTTEVDPRAVRVNMYLYMFSHPLCNVSGHTHHIFQDLHLYKSNTPYCKLKQIKIFLKKHKFT